MRRNLGWLMLGIVNGELIPYSMLSWQFWVIDFAIFVTLFLLLCEEEP